MSFTFLCGMLACCISGCVSVNRFGFAIEGARCALDRIYYDSLNGQLKTTEPKWKGFQKAYDLLNNLDPFIGKVINGGGSSIKSTLDSGDCSTFSSNYIYGKITASLEYLSGLTATDAQIQTIKGYFDTKVQSSFKTIKTNFLDDGCFYYANALIACMKVLAMIYFCLFIITITLAGISMMFYACLKRQGYLITFMHVLWNIIRFFMFSFFIFGAAYGIFFLALRDSIAVVNKLFDPNGFLLIPKKNLFPTANDNKFLIQCLNNTDYNFINELGDESLKIF